MELFIPDEIFLRMVEHAKASTPQECCGILFGKGTEVHSERGIKNTHKNPLCCYKMDAVQMLKMTQLERKNGNEIVAFYHSHPNSTAEPSKLDIGDAVKNGWTEPLYVIISLLSKPPTVRAFKIFATDSFSTDQPRPAPTQEVKICRK
jgi:proteasome lid subunit RPN8/RPN11